jgi:erythromycin esterase
MKRRFLATVARSGLSTILLAYAAIAHCEEDPFSKWAAAHALPITTLDFAGNDSDLLPLESAIGAAHVVAFGEPTHGVHEPLAFRNRLFRFLVERMGFTAIALESGFTESISARSFIEGGEGDAETAARTGLSSWVNRYLENRELIEWMRDYNATASSAGRRRIRFYGIDLTEGERVSGPRRALDYALTFLSRADPATAQKIRASSGDSLPSTDDLEFGSLSAAAQAEFDTSIKATAKAMEKSRKSLVARSSVDEYRWALHNLDVARQLAKCLPLTPPAPPAKVGISAWAPTMTCRDSAMAENVQWALQNEGRQGRLLIFAHNGHVMNTKDDGRRWANVREKPPMMGLHLRRVYGKDLYIIAMSSATASGGLPSKPIEEDSIDSTLVGLGLPLMFLDVRTGRQNKEVLTWLSMRRSLNANVSAQSLITPSTAVDAFFFVNTLTPAIQSSAKAP